MNFNTLSTLSLIRHPSTIICKRFDFPLFYFLNTALYFEIKSDREIVLVADQNKKKLCLLEKRNVSNKLRSD